MKYFNGFSLQNEEALFDAYINKSDMVVVGFSYGAQKAFEYVYETQQRIDKLILLSPAFFQCNTDSFKRTQIHYFNSNAKNYMNKFLTNASYPSKIDISNYLRESTQEELESLLNYQWNEQKIKDILDRNIIIEVFLGMEDKIIDTQNAHQFFSMTTTYMLKGVGHILKERI